MSVDDEDPDRALRDDDPDLALLRALEALPLQPLTPAQRIYKHRRRWGPQGKVGFDRGDKGKGQEAFVRAYNQLIDRYGQPAADLMIKHRIHPFLLNELLIQIDVDRELWFEATGERLARRLSPTEELARECWIWEGPGRTVPDRARDPGRPKPKKSSQHDRPWPPDTAPVPLLRWIAHGAVLELGGHPQHAPHNWAPRRWFPLRAAFPVPRNPLTISTSRPLNRERKRARAELASEVESEKFHQTDGEWEKTSTALVSERNHPKPQGFWWMRAEDRQPDRLIAPLWPNFPAPKWEPCIDEPTPESVLARTHEQPGPPKAPVNWNLQRRLDRLDRWQLATGKRLEEFPVVRARYWRDVRGRPVRHWAFSIVKRALPDADDLDRLATSAAAEAG